MKSFFFLLCSISFAVACNNNVKTSDNNHSDNSTPALSATEETPDYPFQLKEAYKDWQPGNKKNAWVVMKMLKAWETKNVSECASYFGDSVRLQLDYFEKVVKHDSLPAMLEESLADFASVKIQMDDWESVISKDQKEEWVTLWYKQSWVDKKGKADSLVITDDAKIVNGKIVVFDEKIRHFPAAKK